MTHVYFGMHTMQTGGASVLYDYPHLPLLLCTEHCPRMYNHKSAYMGILESALSFLWKHLILYNHRQTYKLAFPHTYSHVVQTGRYAHTYAHTQEWRHSLLGAFIMDQVCQYFQHQSNQPQTPTGRYVMELPHPQQNHAR